MIRLPLILAVALSAIPAYAQCLTGTCGRVYYAQLAPRYASVQPCGAVQQVAQPCAPIQQCEPEPVAAPEPCAPVATCEPVAAPEPCAPIETCEPVAEIQLTAKVADCPSGACPLRAVTKAAVNTATAPVRAVANLLASANATRARYGLPALQFDAALTAGAQTQASYCSRVGGLYHGYGAAEILAQNNQGIETAINQWLASPAHRAMLLNSGYRYAGVSVVRDRYGRSWCAMRFR